eukprot:372504-Hanusia_phi.AAC.1
MPRYSMSPSRRLAGERQLEEVSEGHQHSWAPAGGVTFHGGYPVEFPGKGRVLLLNVRDPMLHEVRQVRYPAGPPAGSCDLVPQIRSDMVVGDERSLGFAQQEAQQAPFSHKLERASCLCMQFHPPLSSLRHQSQMPHSRHLPLPCSVLQQHAGGREVDGVPEVALSDCSPEYERCLRVADVRRLLQQTSRPPEVFRDVSAPAMHVAHRHARLPPVTSRPRRLRQQLARQRRVPAHAEPVERESRQVHLLHHAAAPRAEAGCLPRSSEVAGDGVISAPEAGGEEPVDGKPQVALEAPDVSLTRPRQVAPAHQLAGKRLSPIVLRHVLEHLSQVVVLEEPPGALASLPLLLNHKGTPKDLTRPS